MDFLIADTFTSSLSKLPADDQKLAKTTAFDLQMNPANPGHKLHKLDRAKDPNFWSVRVGSDVRMIVHRSKGSLLLCYVDRHDDAYRWAERRRLEHHPKTGAAQMVVIEESVREETSQGQWPPEASLPKAASAPGKPLFATLSDERLLECGVPPTWLSAVRTVDEDGLLDLAGELPDEAVERLLEIACGALPRPVPEATPPAPGEEEDFAPIAFEHPDAQRRFRTISTAEELQLALDYPWDKWAVFLHPAQQDLVDRSFNGPARVSGSAGTGKTVVALHRAVALARRNPESIVLLTTFSKVLADMLRTKTSRLLTSDPRVGERLEVAALDDLAKRLWRARDNQHAICDPSEVEQIIVSAMGEAGSLTLSRKFVIDEFWTVVDALQVTSWEQYRDVRRLGRKTRLPASVRGSLWSVYERVLRELAQSNRVTRAQVYARLADDYSQRTSPLFDHVVVDESQDLTPQQLRFLAAIAGKGPDSLFMAGDLGQRIFETPFSWLSLGVDIRGRSRTLRVNYRTTQQIRKRADRLLAPSIEDVDGIVERRDATVSLLSGPEPTVHRASTPSEETKFVASWLSELFAQGVDPSQMMVVVRSHEQLDRACGALELAGIPCAPLAAGPTQAGSAVYGTMHEAKGLEYRAVAVMACDDDVLPLGSRIEAVSDEADLDEVYNTERHLLYVAATRARDFLLLSSGGPPSEFLDDFDGL